MKKIISITLILVLHLFSYSEWKNKINEYWDNFEDFRSIIRYLEKNIDKISKFERAEALAILSFAYKNENNIAGEVSCIKKLFKMHKFKSISPGFLNLSGRVKIFDYIDRWKEVFPEIVEVDFENAENGISFFSPKEFINLKIFSTVSAEMEIIDSLNRVIFSVFLKSGQNSVKIPLEIVKIGENITEFNIKVSSGPISIIRKFSIKKEYIVPSGIRFNPRLKKVRLIDRNFKDESKKKIVIDVRKYFDKKIFFRKSLIPLGTGIIFFCVGHFIENTKAVNSEEVSSRRLFWSFGKTSKYFGIGFSVKGIVNFIRSFKRKNIYKAAVIKDPESIRYNKLLRKILRKKRMLIRVKLKLMKAEGKNE